MSNSLYPYQGRVVAAGLLLSFASGATSLVYEVLWTRQFISLFGATTPAIRIVSASGRQG